MSELRKYPRTRHVKGSNFQHGDHDLEAVPWEELRGKHLVIEEKMDGANCGVSFSKDKSLLRLQSRGHYLRGGPRERHFDLFKQWAVSRQVDVYRALGTRYVMYGEWLFAKHTMFYDLLPHYFMEFDVLDTETDQFLDTEMRGMLLHGLGIVPVLVLKSGKFDKLSELEALVGKSHFISNDCFSSLTRAALDAGVLPVDAVRHTDWSGLMEGLYIKWEEDGVVKGRYKYVRGSFTNHVIDQETHWHDRPIIQNGLAPGMLSRLFV
jgi:hypothetical protein